IELGNLTSFFYQLALAVAEPAMRTATLTIRPPRLSSKPAISSFMVMNKLPPASGTEKMQRLPNGTIVPFRSAVPPPILQIRAPTGASFVRHCLGLMNEARWPSGPHDDICPE